MDHDESWPKRVAEEIGERVEYFRKRDGMTAQQLADRCAELGMRSISRTVITKLENGRREAVSTAELQVLAFALGVPAVLLLFPVGRAETIEVLPGRHAGPLDAIEWFTGYSSDPAGRADPQLGTQSPLILWPEHERCQDLIVAIQRDLDERRPRPDGREPSGRRVPDQRIRELQSTIRSLLRIREIMLDTELTPPLLLPEAARILRAAGHRDPYAGPPYPGLRDYFGVLDRYADPACEPEAAGQPDGSA